MQKYKCEKLNATVCVNVSLFDRAETGNPRTLYDCVIHFGNGVTKKMEIVATTPEKAAQYAIEQYHN